MYGFHQAQERDLAEVVGVDPAAAIARGDRLGKAGVQHHDVVEQVLPSGSGDVSARSVAAASLPRDGADPYGPCQRESVTTRATSCLTSWRGFVSEPLLRPHQTARLRANERRVRGSGYRAIVNVQRLTVPFGSLSVEL